MSDPFIIGLVSQKGGVGKSTLAQAIAREAAAEGLSVKIGDLDTQQGTSVQWKMRRAEAGFEPEIFVESYSTAEAAIAANSGGELDLLLLDGPARASKGTLAIARKAALVIQPTCSSLADMLPAIATFNELVKEGIPRSRLVFSLSRVGTKTEVAEAREFLKSQGYDVLDGALYEYTTYRKVQDRGRAVTETPLAKLRRDAETIIEDVVTRIKANIAAAAE